MYCATMQRKLPKAKLNFVYHKEWSLCLYIAKKNLHRYLVSTTTFVISKKTWEVKLGGKTNFFSKYKKIRENGLSFFMNVIYEEQNFSTSICIYK